MPLDIEKQQVIRIPLEPKSATVEHVPAPEGVLRLVCPTCAATIIALPPGTKREGFADATENLCCQSCGQLIELEEPEPEED